jgi:hypothetical protein
LRFTEITFRKFIRYYHAAVLNNLDPVFVVEQYHVVVVNLEWCKVYIQITKSDTVGKDLTLVLTTGLYCFANIGWSYRTALQGIQGPAGAWNKRCEWSYTGPQGQGIQGPERSNGTNGTME